GRGFGLRLEEVVLEATLLVRLHLGAEVAEDLLEFGFLACLDRKSGDDTDDAHVSLPCSKGPRPIIDMLRGTLGAKCPRFNAQRTAACSLEAVGLFNS